MAARAYSFEVETGGEGNFVDISSRVSQLVSESGIETGLVSISVRSTTSSVAISENEEGLMHDLAALFERLAPAGERYDHDSAWGDGNGRSHVKSTLTGQGISLPVVNFSIATGSWQSIFLLEFDVRKRSRTIDVVVVG